MVVVVLGHGDEEGERRQHDVGRGHGETNDVNNNGVDSVQRSVGVRRGGEGSELVRVT